MRELKLDLYSLYPELKSEGVYDYAILVDELNVGAFACESYGAQVTSRATGDYSYKYIKSRPGGRLVH